MNPTQREAAKQRLERLLANNAITRGMYVRARGDHLIIGRNEAFGQEGEVEADDRLRFTARSASTWSLSVRRHTGRWETTALMGNLEELTEVISTLMQHIVAPWS